MADKPTVWTIGHSQLPFEKFVAELKTNGIETLVDVRKLTGSNAFPQYNEDKMGPALRGAGIHYVAMPLLSGRRPRDYDIDPHVNGAWENQSFHNYADYATGAEFAKGLKQLEALATKSRPAIMCSEAVPWRCHRRIIADHLLAQGFPVLHIMDGGKTERATYNPGAVPKDGNVTYPGDNGSKTTKPHGGAPAASDTALTAGAAGQ